MRRNDFNYTSDRNPSLKHEYLESTIGVHAPKNEILFSLNSAESMKSERFGGTTMGARSKSYTKRLPTVLKKTVLKKTVRLYFTNMIMYFCCDMHYPCNHGYRLVRIAAYSSYGLLFVDKCCSYCLNAHRVYPIQPSSDVYQSRENRIRTLPDIIKKRTHLNTVVLHVRFRNR